MTETIVFLDLRDNKPRRMSAPDVPTVLCLGNFDGVHLAHAALLREGLRLRDQHLPGALCGVFCFTKPSWEYLPASGTAPRGGSVINRRLTSLREKLSLFAKMGMDFACLADFPAVRALPPDTFLHMLARHLGCRGAVCGHNYRFGMQGRGNAALLRTYFDNPEKGYHAAVMPLLQVAGDTVSSTRIRRLLLEGDPQAASVLLGRPYALTAPVVHGKQLGRTIGFPTANQFFPPLCVIPAHGVYATRCHTPYGIFAGVSNVGFRPTVEQQTRVNCETYLIGTTQPLLLYNKRIRVEFLHRLRGEIKFSSLEALVAAIRRDADAAAAYVADWQATSYLAGQ